MLGAADTPGVHLHHRLPHMLTPAELKQLHPLKRLVPYFPPSPAVIADTEGQQKLQGAAQSNDQSPAQTLNDRSGAEASGALLLLCKIAAASTLTAAAAGVDAVIA